MQSKRTKTVYRFDATRGVKGNKGKLKELDELDYLKFKKELEMPKDACYHKVVARYGPKTSAYRSGAMAKCRKVGAANWGNKSKKEKGGLATSLMSDVYGSGRKLKKK